MAWDVWYEQSLRWTPSDPVDPSALRAWTTMLGTLAVPTRLLISAAVHRALQHEPMAWPQEVRRVDTLLTPDDTPDGLDAWRAEPSSWGWLWRAPLRKGHPQPDPTLWPTGPSFKAELIAHPDAEWPHAASWWLHWAAHPMLQTVPLEVWLDERQGVSPARLVAWDRWVQQVGRLVADRGWPVKPWNDDADVQDDPRWDPTHHLAWDGQALVLDRPFWDGTEDGTGLVGAPCATCAAAVSCPGPRQPRRWATAAGVCSQGRSWRTGRTHLPVTA